MYLAIYHRDTKTERGVEIEMASHFQKKPSLFPRRKKVCLEAVMQRFLIRLLPCSSLSLKKLRETFVQ